MLTALTETLKGNQRFQQVKPYYHKGGEMYFLDDKGEVVSGKDDTWAGHMEGFNINHNVAPAGLALGANGCGDCHSDTGPHVQGPDRHRHVRARRQTGDHQCGPALRLRTPGPST